MTSATAAWVGDGYDPECPTRVLLDRVGDKWTVLVIGVLADGPMRFTALRDRVGGVSGKVLTATLRALARDGLVTRTAYPTIPPRVDYELTDLGRSLQGPLDVIRDWSEQHIAAVIAHRDKFDDGASE
ncbi:putative transcriptional regulator [Flexivirga endophytica]|uniref:Transcriptional regulator n=1 Tax=Flexivirga endophytica TaxID=1849103 RepID=A0A916T3A4_9MICO|nr:helix-turn-helix domain-containing protein [Flexivirga endophytica]GGB29371.1 putative transcriptional regulator [Flexivirga endophytica]GHB50466.1 putative transcriptional regulator [Flexivirga endophytica]